MPEGPEVETESLHESIREELEKEGGGFLRKIALTTALLAVLAAVSALRAGATVNHALLMRTDATQLQSQASNQWAYYQAKGVKAAVQEAIKEKAVELEKERDAKVKESDHLLHGHHGFANAVALFQVAIALGAIAALTRNRLVWAGSLVVGLGGLALLVRALL